MIWESANVWLWVPRDGLMRQGPTSVSKLEATTARTLRPEAVVPEVR